MIRPIVIQGAFNAETVVCADRQPRRGEAPPRRGFALGPGGKGSNQAVAAARAGGHVHFVTRLGGDPCVEMARETWAHADVRPRVGADPDHPAGATFVFIEDTTGNNPVIGASDAAGALPTADIDARAKLIRDAGVFATSLEQGIEAARHALALARKGGARTVLNPAPAAPLDDEFLPLCDLITPNETEVEALTGIAVVTLQDAERAAGALSARGVGAVVITLGVRGSFYRDAGLQLHVPAMYAGPTVDTAGVGDAFMGALAVALAEGVPPEDALRFATATAAISVTRPGAARSMPCRAEIVPLLARSRRCCPMGR